MAAFDRMQGLEPLESRLLLSTTFEVTSLADNVANDGDVTLREAVEAANTDTSVGDAPAGSGADVIEFAVRGAIPLSQGQMQITDGLEIRGPGADQLTIDAQNSSRIFEISGPAGSNVTLSGLRLTDGEVDSAPGGGFAFGGGIKADGGVDLTLDQVALVNHEAVNNDGGGLSFSGGGQLTIRDSVLAGNESGGSGGAIELLASPATIVNSAISGNRADGSGGGVVGFFADQVRVHNSTIADNSAGGSGGGLFLGSEQGFPDPEFVSALIGDNSTGGTGPSLAFSAPFGINPQADAQHSLFEDAGNFSFTTASSDNITGQDPQLMPLGDYGGPTETHALMPGSPALAAGTNPLNLNHDQRGEFYSRTRQEGSFFPFFDVTDIGAYQAQNVNYTVDQRTAEVDGDYSDGEFSLREAIQEANANPGTTRGIDLFPALPGTGIESADTINFDDDLVDSVAAIIPIPAVAVTADDGPLTITDDVTITGNGAEQFTVAELTGSANSRVFEVDDGDSGRQVEVTLEDMTIANVSGDTSSGDGGGLLNQEDLLIRRSEVRGFVGDDGGAIYNGASGHLTVDRSLMRDNEGNFGGAVYNDGQFDLINSTLSNNSAADDGGAIFNSTRTSAALTVNNSTVTQNDAADEGGGIFNATGADATVNSTIVADNTAGGLLVDSGPNLDGLFAGDFTMVGSAPDGSFPVFSHYTLNGVSNQLATDPALQPLADHGGPTQTHALGDGSPAIDAGSNPENLDVDQRGEGFPRVKGPQADIGAFETGADVIARRVFYNNSTLDGGDPAANADDDNAIDGGKQPLLPGDSAAPANITAYGKGLNGITIDIDTVAGTVSADDFELRVGNSSDPSTWSDAPTPSTVTVRSGEGTDGSDRVTLTFADDAIEQQWLEVTVLSYEESGGDLGVADEDRFYFGNLPADFDGNGVVDVIDLGTLGLNFGQSISDVDAGDVNGSGVVDVVDLGILRLNFQQSLTSLSAPAASSETGEVSQASPQIAGSTETDETETEVDLIRGDAADDQRLAAELRTDEAAPALDTQPTVQRWTPLTLDGEQEDEGVEEEIARLVN